MGRKAQMKIVLGLQNRAQLEMRYDLEAETIMSQPYTKIILRLSDSRSAEMASKCVGDQEAEDQRVDTCFEICHSVRKSLRNDALVIASIQRRPGQRLDCNHCAKKFLWKRSHCIGAYLLPAKSKAASF